MTLNELTTQFTGLFNRRDLTSNTALVTSFINQAIMRVQRELRVPAMEKSVLVTIAAPYKGLVIPNDMLELIQIMPQATDNLQSLPQRSITRALVAAQTTGAPQMYARQGGVWVLGPSPSVGDVIRVDYYAELTPLVNPTDTNVMSIIAWDLIVYAALSITADWFNDKRGPGFEARYGQIRDAIQEQADWDALDGQAAVMPAYRFPSDGNDYTDWYGAW